jgi:hypothetical protein
MFDVEAGGLLGFIGLIDLQMEFEFVTRVQITEKNCLSPLGNIPDVYYVTLPDGVPPASILDAVSCGEKLSEADEATFVTWCNATLVKTPPDTVPLDTVQKLQRLCHMVAFIRTFLFHTVEELQAACAAKKRLPLEKDFVLAALQPPARQALQLLLARAAHGLAELFSFPECTNVPSTWRDLVYTSAETVLLMGSMGFAMEFIRTLEDVAGSDPSPDTAAIMSAYGEWTAASLSLFQRVYPNKNTGYVARVCYNLSKLRKVLFLLIQKHDAAGFGAAVASVFQIFTAADMDNTRSRLRPDHLNPGSPTMVFLYGVIKRALLGAAPPVHDSILRSCLIHIAGVTSDYKSLVSVKTGLDELLEVIGLCGVEIDKGRADILWIYGKLFSRLSEYAWCVVKQPDLLAPFYAAIWAFADRVKALPRAEAAATPPDVRALMKAALTELARFVERCPDMVQTIVGPLDSLHLRIVDTFSGFELESNMIVLLVNILNVAAATMAPATLSTWVEVLLKMERAFRPTKAVSLFKKYYTIIELRAGEHYTKEQAEEIAATIATRAVDPRWRLGACIVALRDWQRFVDNDTVHVMAAWMPSISRDSVYLDEKKIAEFRALFPPPPTAASMSEGEEE